MDAEALRALQAPLKSRYRDEPDAALITLRAEGQIDHANIACKVETGRALVTAGLHPATGGSGYSCASAIWASGYSAPPIARLSRPSSSHGVSSAIVSRRAVLGNS